MQDAIRLRSTRLSSLNWGKVWQYLLRSDIFMLRHKW
jgi:hypothetical protein